MTTTKIQRNWRVPRDLADSVRALSDSEGVSQNKLVESLLRDGVRHRQADSNVPVTCTLRGERFPNFVAVLLPESSARLLVALGVEVIEKMRVARRFVDGHEDVRELRGIVDVLDPGPEGRSQFARQAGLSLRFPMLAVLSVHKAVSDLREELLDHEGVEPEDITDFRMG